MTTKMRKIIQEFFGGNKSAEEASKDIHALCAGLSREEKYKKLFEELGEELNLRFEALDRVMRDSLKSCSKPFGG